MVDIQRSDIASADRIIRQAELAKILGVSSVTLWRWRQNNKFPAPIKLGSGRMIGWRMSSILQWIDEQEVLD